MRRFACLLGCLLLLLLLPACGEQEKGDGGSSFLDSHPNTQRSEDVQMSVSAFGTNMDNFFRQIRLRNLSETLYCREDRYYFEKKVDGQWISLPVRTSINGIDIGLDSYMRYLPPDENVYVSCFPLFSTEEALEPGVEYRVLTRLYEYTDPVPGGSDGPDAYILAMAEFAYPANELEWVDDGLFSNADGYAPMMVFTKDPYNLGNRVLDTFFSLPKDASGKSADLLDCRPYIQRLENGFWKTAPFFQNVTMGSVGSAGMVYGGQFNYTFYPSWIYNLSDPDMQYRLILVVDYCYADSTDQVQTVSFCGAFSALSSSPVGSGGDST